MVSGGRSSVISISFFISSERSSIKTPLAARRMLRSSRRFRRFLMRSPVWINRRPRARAPSPYDVRERDHTDGPKDAAVALCFVLDVHLREPFSWTGMVSGGHG